MEHADLSMIRDGTILLGSGLVFVLLFRRLGLGATLGFLVAGAVVGPHLLGLVGDAEAKLGFAELGITLLLFIVGLELSPQRLWRLKEDIFGLGLIQVVAVILVTGTATGMPEEIDGKPIYVVAASAGMIGC